MLVAAGWLAGFATLGAGSPGLPGPAAAAQSGDALPTVINARLGLHPDKTRFVLEVSERIAFRATVQGDPYRVVVDLPELAWPGGEAARRGMGVIRSYHAEHPQPGSLRLVLEMAGPVHLGTAMLMEPSEGHQSRLVIDVAATTPEAFLAEKDQARGAPRPVVRDPAPQVAAVAPAPAPPPARPAASQMPPTPTVVGVPATVPGPARTPPVSLVKAPPPAAPAATAYAAPAAMLAAAPAAPPPAAPAVISPAVMSDVAPPAPVHPPLAAHVAGATPVGAPASGPPVSLKPSVVPNPAPVSPTPAVLVTRTPPRAEPAPVSDGAPPVQVQGQSTVQLVAAAAPPPPPSPPVKPRRAPPARPMIALDPGHGGVDPGATGINGIHEKDITLATAREVKRQLEATGRFRVIMTRDDDEFVPLRERVARARQAGADLFVSLHADSIARTEIRGLSIYTQSDKGSDHEAETLAAKENRADAIGGIDLSHENDQVATILIDLAQRDTRNHSRRFATTMLREAAHVIRLLPQPDRAAAFAVLTAPDVPSVLIEMGYLSNVEDAALLTQPMHRARLAGSLVHAVEGYFAWLSGGRRS